MKIAYIAHPISDRMQERIEQVKFIQFHIYKCEPNVIPFAPYVRALECLNDADPVQRKQGMDHNTHFLESGIIDEVRLYGDTLSKGMVEECLIALREQIPIKAMTTEMLILAEKFLRNSVS